MPETTSTALAEIAKLIDQYVALQKRGEELDDLVEKNEARKKAIVGVDGALQLLMDEHGFKKIETENGMLVTIKETIKASIPKRSQVQGFRWLEDHGFGDYIKQTVTAAFPRGGKEQAGQLLIELEGDAYDCDAKSEEKVNANSLSALVRSIIDEGGTLPENDEFTIMRLRTADVKPAK